MYLIILDNDCIYRNYYFGYILNDYQFAYRVQKTAIALCMRIEIAIPIEKLMRIALALA